MQTITITTGPCYVCGKTGVVENVPAEGYDQWKRGAFIQDALPTLTAGDREQLLTGTHSECFDKLFPPDEDDE